MVCVHRLIKPLLAAALVWLITSNSNKMNNNMRIVVILCIIILTCCIDYKSQEHFSKKNVDDNMEDEIEDIDEDCPSCKIKKPEPMMLDNIQQMISSARGEKVTTESLEKSRQIASDVCRLAHEEANKMPDIDYNELLKSGDATILEKLSPEQRATACSRVMNTFGGVCKLTNKKQQSANNHDDGIIQHSTRQQPSIIIMDQRGLRQKKQNSTDEIRQLNDMDDDGLTFIE